MFGQTFKDIAENLDLFDVIEFIRFAAAPIPRKIRSQNSIMKFENLTDSEKDFIDFLADQCVARGVEELDEPRLELLLEAKYLNVIEGFSTLGKVDVARRLIPTF